jgi:hypothetical protein
MAQAFAKRLQGASLEEKITHGCSLLTLEPPDKPVVQALLKLHQTATAEFQKNPADAKKLGATPEDAALVLVANTLFNLDLSMVR